MARPVMSVLDSVRHVIADPSSREFQRMVSAITKGEAPDELVHWLRTDGLDAWVTALQNAVQDVNTELQAKNLHWEEFKAEPHDPDVYRKTRLAHLDWKRRALFFQKHAVRSLTEAKRLQKERNIARSNEEGDARKLCSELADFLDEAVAAGALPPEFTARAEALLDRVPEWL